MNEVLISPDLKFLREDAEGLARTRLAQSLNAPRATFFQQGVITDAAVVRVEDEQLHSNAVIYSFMVLVLDKVAQDARYMINGSTPTATGRGIQIAGGNGSGGVTLTITGQENIRAFRIVGETGNVCPYSLQLFR